MLKIRLKSLGRKKEVFYHIAVMHALSQRNAESIEDIGFYDPKKKILKIDRKKLKKFLVQGAYPTSTVRHLIYKYQKAKKVHLRKKKIQEVRNLKLKKVLAKKLRRVKKHYSRNYKKLRKKRGQIYLEYLAKIQNLKKNIKEKASKSFSLFLKMIKKQKSRKTSFFTSLLPISIK
jgi:small subunit ribosomal protein S16